MNTTNSSSYVGFIDSTSTGGNSSYLVKEIPMVLFRNGSMKVPTPATRNSILESENKASLRFSDVDELLDFLND